MSRPRAPVCAFTCSESFGESPIFGRNLAAWRRETLRLLRTVTVNRRVDAGRLTALEVHLADAHEMAVHNYRHLKHRGATDVLTFPMADLAPRMRVRDQKSTRTDRRVAGVVIVCPAIAAREATERRLAPGDELLRYILHGVLHLLGEDDKTAPKRKRMHALQERLLTAYFAPKKVRVRSRTP